MSVLLSPSPSSSSSANFKFAIYLLILLSGVQLIDAFCDEHHWWQEELNECIPCTVCDARQSIVLRPCQKHSDTVCGTFDDVEVELDWLRAAAVAAEHKQVSCYISTGNFFLFRCFGMWLFSAHVWISIIRSKIISTWESLKRQAPQCSCGTGNHFRWLWLAWCAYCFSLLLPASTGNIHITGKSWSKWKRDTIQVRVMVLSAYF